MYEHGSRNLIGGEVQEHGAERQVLARVDFLEADLDRAVVVCKRDNNTTASLFLSTTPVLAMGCQDNVERMGATETGGGESGNTQRTGRFITDSPPQIDGVEGDAVRPTQLQTRWIHVLHQEVPLDTSVGERAVPRPRTATSGHRKGNNGKTGHIEHAFPSPSSPILTTANHGVHAKPNK